MTERLKAYLFGTLTLERGTDSLSLPPLVDARTLLAYLLLYHARPHPRAALAALIAPRQPESRARRALTQALYHLRQALPETVLVTDTDTVRIAPHAPLWVDVAAFEALVENPLEAAPSDLYRAVELYRGDLLEGLYDDWTLLERERLREQYLQTLERLIEVEKGAGRDGRALELALSLLDADPLREATHREVMRLYYALGRPEAALQQFATCRQTLQAEMALEPARETLALAREIADRSGHPRAPYLPEIRLTPPPLALEGSGGTEIPLVGRTDERAQLLKHVEAVLGGDGGLLFVEGEAGVGKSRLVHEVARDAEWRGAQVLWGHCLEQRPSSVYQPLVDAVDGGLSPLRADQLARLAPRIWSRVLGPLIPNLAHALPDLAPPPPLAPGREQERLVDAFGGLLTIWAEITPLLLVVEDLHWADRDTLDLLSHLTRRLDQQPVLIIITYRYAQARARAEVWETVRALDRRGPRQRLTLDRLTADATAELIRRGLGLEQAAPLFERRVYRETDGNPLFVLETLRTLYEEGLLTRDQSGRWHTPFDESTADYAEIPLPAGVEQLIARRLDRLSPPLRRILHAAAVLGNHFDFSLLNAVSAQETVDTLAAVQELVELRLLTEAEQDYRFSHDKIQQVAYEAIPQVERTTLHRRAAEAIQASDPDQALQLAQHFTRGEVWDRAVTHHVRAGERTGATYATQAALDHYAQALDILNEHQPFDPRCAAGLRFDILADRQRLLWIVGEVEQQEKELAALLQVAEVLGDPERQAQALNQQADFSHNVLNRQEEARDAAEAALALAQKHDLARQAATAWEHLDALYYRAGKDQQAVAAVQEALSIWQDLGERTRAAEAHLRLARARQQLGETDQAQAAVEAALEHAQAADDPLALAQAHQLMGGLAFFHGDYDTAIAHTQTSLKGVQTIGFRHLEARLLSNLGTFETQLRHYGPAITCLKEAVEIFRAIGEKSALGYGLSNLGALYVTTGRYAEAEVTLEETLALASEINQIHLQTLALKSLGQLRLDQGDPAAARERFQQLSRLADQLQAPHTQAHEAFCLGLLHLAREEMADAAAHFERAQDGYLTVGQADEATAARSFLAACQLALGHPEEALRLSSQAVAELETRSGDERVATIYLHHWRILQAVGQAAEARAALEKAQTLVRTAQATLPDPAWRRDFSNIPVNREILDAHAEMQAALRAGQITVPLAHIDAPTGRPLRQDERILVDWTVQAPEDEAITGKVARRRHRLLRLLDEAQRADAAPTVGDLAAALKVSRSTIKRDLAALRQAGHRAPTRGSRSSK